MPGGVDQAERDAATFFETELPIVAAWTFGPDRATAITCPVLSVLGTDSGPLFAESDRLLHEWFPNCADAVLPGVTHLLQMEATEAVADAVGAFLRSASTAATTGASDSQRGARPGDVDRGAPTAPTHASTASTDVGDERDAVQKTGDPWELVAVEREPPWPLAWWCEGTTIWS